MFNNTQYFAGLKTHQEIKKHYRNLAMQHHPDHGGDTATMQFINAQYQAALKRCNGQVTVETGGKEHTYKYNEAMEQAVIDFLDRLIKSRIITPAIDAYLIGTWVWVTGDTKPVKDTLKTLGCKWHSKRECWFWHAEEKRQWYSRKGLESLAYQYGASKIKGITSEEIAA